MKIVLAVHHFPPHYTSGAEWQVFHEAAALRARGHTVHVVCVERIDQGSADGLTWKDDEYAGLSVHRLFNLAAAPDPDRWEYDNPWVGEHLRTWLGELRPDIFHLVSGYLLTASALQSAGQLAIPTVVTLTDFWFLCRRISLLRSNGQLSTLPIDPVTCAQCLGEESRRFRWPGRVAPGLMRSYWRRQTEKIQALAARQQVLQQTLNQANVIIGNSQFLRSVYVQAGVPAEQMVFVRQGQDFLDGAPAPVAETPGPTLRVGYLGQLAPVKGVDVLLEGVRQMPAAPLTLQIYGDPAPFPAYTARLRRLAAGDSRIAFKGVFARETIGQVLQNLDVVVVPSVWYENSPNVILESFGHRTPVIASNLGGMAELVQAGRNGLLFAPGNAADLAQQLRRLLDEPGLVSDLRNGIEPVKSVAQEVDELEIIYRRVAARKASA